MEKILNLLKDNQALRTLDTDNGTIVTNSTSDEAYLIAGSFWHNPRKILIIKNNQYEAFNLYKTLTELVNQVVYFPADESLRVEKNDTTDSDFVCHHISFLWDDADCRK